MAALPDDETYLEAGFAAFTLLLLGAGFALALGRLLSGRSRARGTRAEPPESGAVPRQRHENISSNSAR